jgi:formylglycine-generating enzyme required for sulfatase activity
LLPTSSSGIPSSSQKTLLAEVRDMPAVAKVYCKRCGAEAKPFSKYCESCGNTLDLSKEAAKIREEAAKGGIELAPADQEPSSAQPVVTAGGNQAEAPSAKLQTPPAERRTRQTVVEPAPDFNRGGRSTDAIGESSLTSDLPVPRETAETRVSNKSGEIRVSSSLPMPPPDLSASQDSARLVQQSDSMGAIVVWSIIVVLTLAAGLVAWRLLNDTKEQSQSGSEQTAAQPPESVAPPQGQSASGPQPATAPEGMVYVPGSVFKLGREDGDEFESPAHTVTVAPFFIDRTEVTNEAYSQFVTGAPHRPPPHWTDGEAPAGMAKLPVVNVSWEDAVSYAKWAGKRLPTEEEWEFAARGADGRIYTWGNAWIEGYANAGRDRDGKIVEVGRFSSGVSPFGALDMCGNVWEWTSSDYKDYPGRKTPSLLAGSGLKVIRGGAYDVTPQRATTTYRGAVAPDRIFDKTGFRCARDAR